MTENSRGRVGSTGASLLLLFFLLTGIIYGIQLFGPIGPLVFLLTVLSILGLFVCLDARRVRRYRRMSEATSISTFWARRSEHSSTGTLLITEAHLRLTGPHRLPETLPWSEVTRISLQRPRLPIGSACTMYIQLSGRPDLQFQVVDANRLVNTLKQHAPNAVNLD